MSAMDWIDLAYANRDWLTLFAVFVVVFTVVATICVGAWRAVVAMQEHALERGYEKGFDRGYLVGRHEERTVKAVETSDPYGMDAMIRFYKGPLGVPWTDGAEDRCENCGAVATKFDPEGVSLCEACADDSLKTVARECLALMKDYQSGGRDIGDLQSLVKDWIAAEAAIPPGEYEGADGLEDVVRWAIADRDEARAHVAKLEQICALKGTEL